MVRRLGVTFLAIVVTCLVAPPVSARQLDVTPVAVTGPLAQFWGYATPVLVVEKAGDLTYSNLDVVKHDLVHDVESDGFGTKKKMPWCKKAKKKDGHDHHHGHGGACPVFWSPLVGTGQTSEVLGLENLKPGKTYTFFCTLHHGMKGTLIAR